MRTLFCTVMIFLNLAAPGSSATGASFPALYDEHKAGKDVELAFVITDLATDPSGAYVLTLTAGHGADEVSFQFVLPLKWHKGAVILHQQSYDGIGKLRSTGAGTEKLAASLAKALKVRTRPFEFSEAEVALFLLNGPPSNIAKQEVRMQINHSSLPKEDYASLHCLLDLPGRRMELMRAETCRPAAIVQLFTRKAPPPKSPPP